MSEQWRILPSPMYTDRVIIEGGEYPNTRVVAQHVRGEDAEQIVAALAAQQPADLAPDPRDVELERLKEFAAAFWRPVAADMEHGILSIDTVRFIAQDFLSALHDRAYMEFPRDAALQAVPERPAASEGDDGN